MIYKPVKIDDFLAYIEPSKMNTSSDNLKGTTTKPRKAIPKKIRGEAWKIQFGDSTKGSCFCCKKDLDIFDNWHAGHIISHSNNGTDTADNLRPVCGSCNLSMGTENMDAFKARCYPNQQWQPPAATQGASQLPLARKLAALGRALPAAQHQHQQWL